MIMEQDALISNGENIRRGAAPDSVKEICRAASHVTLGIAVIMQNSTFYYHRENI